jgi:plasmid stability protein
MARLLVRDLENEVVQALKQRAAKEGTSMEEAHRRLFRQALLKDKPKVIFFRLRRRSRNCGDA